MNTIFSEIEEIVSYDIGGRGIKNLTCPGDLRDAVATIESAKNIAIITGFYVEKAAAGETDGPAGAISLCKALAPLGKKLTLITDELNQGILKAGLKTLGEHSISLLIFPLGPQKISASQLMAEEKFDHLIFIERAGPAKDGHYYNAKGIKMTSYTARIDLLLDEANRLDIPTTGIGDGGNEIGMGKVYEKVVDNVRFGDVIGSVANTDYLLSCGTSNWGAWALLAGLSVLKNTILLPSDDFEENVLKTIVVAGAVDAVTHKNELTVDGFPLACHLEILSKLRLVLENCDQRRLVS